MFTQENKFTLRKYLEELDLRDSASLERKSSQIMEKIRSTMNPYALGECGRELQEYYEPAVILIENAYEKNDFNEKFPQALEFMISSIEWE